MITQNALNLIKQHTGGSFNVTILYGVLYKQQRREILEAVTGEKYTLAKSGIHVLVKKMNEIYTPEGNCIAGREESLINILKSLDVNP